MSKLKRLPPFSKLSSRYSKIPTELLLSKVLDSDEKLIVMYISSFATCYSSTKTIADICGRSVATIKRVMARLKERQLIDWRKRVGTSSLYWIKPMQSWVLDEPTQLTQTHPLAHSELPPSSHRPTTYNKVLSIEATEGGDVLDLEFSQWLKNDFKIKKDISELKEADRRSIRATFELVVNKNWPIGFREHIGSEPDSWWPSVTLREVNREFAQYLRANGK